MNPLTLEQVFEAARQLSPPDQRALVGRIDRSLPPKTLEEMAIEQGIGPFDFQAAWKEAESFWPENENIDDFIAWLRAERGHGSVRLEPDVAEVFKTAEAVNEVLRTIIGLINALPALTARKS